MSNDVNIFKYQSRPVVYLCASAHTPACVYKRFLLKYIVINIISYTSVCLSINHVIFIYTLIVPWKYRKKLSFLLYTRHFQLR